jgi:hypothetical protein
MELRKETMGAIKCCLLFLSILLIACQGVQRTIAPENRIALLQGGPHSGSWESNDVFLEYQYVKQPGIIKLDINLKAKRKFDQLSVWVSFLDTEGKILETKSVFNSGYRRKESSGLSLAGRYKGSVEKTFEMPMDINHLAFRSSLQPYTDQRD